MLERLCQEYLIFFDWFLYLQSKFHQKDYCVDKERNKKMYSVTIKYFFKKIFPKGVYVSNFSCAHCNIITPFIF